MAEPITMQKLTDASFDADTLGEFANEDKMVVSRLGLEYPSAPMASRLLVENGLLGATPFSTYDDMAASSLVDGDYAVVTNDADLSKNGVYQKIAGAWVYLAYNSGAKLNKITNLLREEYLTANIFNKNTVSKDMRISSATGKLFEQSGYSTSDYIEVKGNTHYNWNYTNRSAFYDINQEMISIGDETRSGLSPANAKYFRFTTATNFLDETWLVEGTVVPNEYVPFSKSVYVGNIPAEKNQLAELLSYKIKSGKNQVDFISRTSPQLFDDSKLVNGVRVSQDSGLLLDYLSDSNVSDFIPVKPSTAYSQNYGNYFAEYDANKEFVRGYATGVTQFTTSSDTHFLRVTVRDVRLPDYMLSEGTDVKPYQPYHIYALDDNIQTSSDVESKWAGKKWNVMGDSHTADANSYWRHIASDKQFAVARDYGVSGSSIARRTAPEGVENPELWTQQWLANRYKSMDDDADLVTIAAGANDFLQVPLGSFDERDDTTVFGALRDLLEGVVNKYPTASIGFIVPFSRHNIQTAYNPYKHKELRDAIKECCEFYNIPYFDSVLRLPIRFYNASQVAQWSRIHNVTGLPDGVHLNAEAHEIIAPIIGNWIENL